MSAKPKDDIKIGNKYGRLLVQEKYKKPRKNGSYEAQAKCLCECGSTYWIAETRLRRGCMTECRRCVTRRAWNKVPRLPKHETWLRVQEKNYRSTAATKGRDFLLTREEFREIYRGTCAYCGTFPAHGIDRRDNSKGYILENSVPCCFECNFAKRDMSVEEFIQWVKRVYKFSGWKKV